MSRNYDAMSFILRSPRVSQPASIALFLNSQHSNENKLNQFFSTSGERIAILLDAAGFI